MILNNNLYTVKECRKEGEGMICSVSLNPDCFIYQAHFPGNPITPGVCILQIATEMLQEHLGRKLELKVVNNVKYLAVISPTENPDIDYVFSAPTIADDTLKVKIVVKNEKASFAKISLTYSM